MYGEKRRLKTLGRYPSLSLADARKRAKEFQVIQLSVDPSATSYEYEAVRDAYIEDCARRLRASTLEGYLLYLQNITFQGPIKDIARGDVLREIQAYTKSASSQNYAFTTFKVFFNWAVRRQFLETNPLGALKRPNRQVSRERVLYDEELRRLLHYAREQSSRYNDIVTMLVLTGQRRGEIAGLQWSEIEDSYLALSAERTKNKRNHVVPLGVAALRILHSIQGGRHYVFGTPDNDRPFNGWGRAQRRLIRETGLDHFTLHDLRRTYSTIHAQLGTPIHVTEKLLNHVSGSISGVAAVYNRHSYLEEMKAAVALYDQYIEDLLRKD
jgi:integrase